MTGEHFPASITLGNNFRSRTEVTEAVNFVFRQLMTREAGGIDYDDREALVPSAVYPENPDCAAELLVVDSSLNDEEDTKDAAEARVIAKRIREMMADFTVTDKGTARPAATGISAFFCAVRRLMPPLMRMNWGDAVFPPLDCRRRRLLRRIGGSRGLIPSAGDRQSFAGCTAAGGTFLPSIRLYAG